MKERRKKMVKVTKPRLLVVGCLSILILLAPLGLVAESQEAPGIEELLTPPGETEFVPAGVSAIPGEKSAQVGPNILVNDPTDLDSEGRGIVQSETSIAVFDNNIAVGWNDSKGFFEAVGVSGWGVSTNFGTIFTDGGGLPLDNGNTRGDPAMTVCPDGTFHYANLFENPAGGNSALSVHSGTVSGGTINWGSPVIAVESATDFLDKEYLVCGPNGDLYMSYTRFIDSGGNGQIEFVRSTDGNTTWSSPLVLQAAEDVVNQGSYPAAGPHTSDQVCVAWQRGWLDADPVDTIEVRCSTNRGGSFGPRVTAATFISNAWTEPIGYNRSRVSDFPGIDIDKSSGPHQGTIYVSYQDGDLDIRDVKLTKSTDGGATWSAPVTINDDAGDGSDEFWPWVNVSQDDGTVGVLWYSNLNGFTDVFLDISPDGSGGADLRVTDVTTDWTATAADAFPNFGDYINLASSPGFFHATWADGRLGTPDVFYASIFKGRPPQGDLITHYMGYKIVDRTVKPGKVEVEDQFGRRVIKLRRDKFLLVPAVKNPGQ
jgi:hypothetical protein